MIIDPRKTIVYGYESPACLEMLVSLMVGIIEKDCIPSVKVFTFDYGKTYEIPYPESERFQNGEAGHHRALAAYLLGENLEAEVVDQIAGGMGKIEIPEHLRLSLDQIAIVSDPKKFDFERNVMNKKYRALPKPDDFFGKYRKINVALKCGTGMDFSLSRDAYIGILDRINISA